MSNLIKKMKGFSFSKENNRKETSLLLKNLILSQKQFETDISILQNHLQ